MNLRCNSALPRLRPCRKHTEGRVRRAQRGARHQVGRAAGGGRGRGRRAAGRRGSRRAGACARRGLLLVPWRQASDVCLKICAVMSTENEKSLKVLKIPMAKIAGRRSTLLPFTFQDAKWPEPSQIPFLQNIRHCIRPWMSIVMVARTVSACLPSERCVAYLLRHFDLVAGPTKCTYFPGTTEKSPHLHYRP
jgi:hypothetical protein